ncbi:MAG: hypothetical protein ACLVJ6_03110 [Merdibacter sp.]
MIEIKQISSYIMDSGERLLIGGERRQVLERRRRFLFTKLEKLFSANRRKEARWRSMPGSVNSSVSFNRRTEL